jgi:DNA-binding transcriptional ArsR family regulator
VDYRHREGGTMLTTDPKLRVLEALQAREGMTAMQVAGRTMLPPSAVVRVLRTLLEAAVVTLERDRRGRQRYFLANRDRTARSRGRHLSGVAH